MSRKWRNWYQNELDEETKGADSRDKVKNNGKSDQSRHKLQTFRTKLSISISHTFADFPVMNE